MLSRRIFNTATIAYEKSAGLTAKGPVRLEWISVSPHETRRALATKIPAANENGQRRVPKPTN